MANYPKKISEPADDAGTKHEALDVRQEVQGGLNLILTALEVAQLNGSPLGTFVVVNIDTGEYVAADNFMNANTAFLKRFPGARGFAHRLGEPLFEPLEIDPH